MTKWIDIRHFFAVLAVLGLLLGPIVSPAAAQMSVAGMSDEMADMPCCPMGRSAIPDASKACPLMAFCVVKVVDNRFERRGTIVRVAVAHVLWTGDDAAPESRSSTPPSRPPRS
jgi:hypothetical protein